MTDKGGPRQVPAGGRSTRPCQARGSESPYASRSAPSAGDRSSDSRAGAPASGSGDRGKEDDEQAESSHRPQRAVAGTITPAPHSSSATGRNQDNAGTSRSGVPNERRAWRVSTRLASLAAPATMRIPPRSTRPSTRRRFTAVAPASESRSATAHAVSPSARRARYRRGTAITASPVHRPRARPSRRGQTAPATRPTQDSEIEGRRRP
jgi:hypothetical protein